VAGSHNQDVDRTRICGGHGLAMLADADGPDQ
jgi:hypothetical protein